MATSSLERRIARLERVLGIAPREVLVWWAPWTTEEDLERKIAQMEESGEIREQDNVRIVTMSREYSDGSPIWSVKSTSA